MFGDEMCEMICLGMNCVEPIVARPRTSNCKIAAVVNKKLVFNNVTLKRYP